MKTIKNQVTDLICIVCPQGCRLHVEVDNGEFNVSGNTCKRGVTYAVNELTAPTRVVTSTISLKNSKNTLIPVKTAAAIPKELIFDCMAEINKVSVEAPIKMGTIVIENVLETGVNVVATRTID